MKKYYIRSKYCTRPSGSCNITNSCNIFFILNKWTRNKWLILNRFSCTCLFILLLWQHGLAVTVTNIHQYDRTSIPIRGSKIYKSYQTYWRICSGQINDFLWKNKKNSPFWRHFCSTNFWTKCFFKSNICKYRWHNNQRKSKKNRLRQFKLFETYPNFSPFLHIFRAEK